MNAARNDTSQASVTADMRALPGWPRTLFGLLLAAAFTLPPASALAQDGGLPMPKFSIGGEQKRKLTPEEEEQQKKIDADYKAATRKIPDQKTADPWADVRQAPATASPKASSPTQNASAQKKKQSAQQAH
jgi:hypothetical protein